MPSDTVIQPEALYQDILDQITDGVYLVDASFRIIYWNRAAERITGFEASDVIGSRCSDNILIHVDETGRNLCKSCCPLHHCVCDATPRTTDIFLHHRDGHRVPVHVRAAPLRDRFGRVIGAVETFTDNSARLADLDRIQRLEQLAYLDALTGVANRRFAEITLDARFAEFGRNPSPFGAIVCDIDSFKRFNDTHGHTTGDRVLKMVAQTLSHNVRSFDLVGRWGGEEFLIVLTDVDKAALVRRAELLRMLVSRSAVNIDGTMLAVTISVGASIVLPGDTPGTLVGRCDKLMYKSKLHGRNRVSTA